MVSSVEYSRLSLFHCFGKDFRAVFTKGKVLSLKALFPEGSIVVASRQSIRKSEERSEVYTVAVVTPCIVQDDQRKKLAAAVAKHFTVELCEGYAVNVSEECRVAMEIERNAVEFAIGSVGGLLEALQSLTL